MDSAKKWLPRRGPVPVDPMKRRAVNPYACPEHYLSRQDANAVRDDDSNSCDGVGFVLTPDDPYFFVDIDRHYIGGNWSELSQEICRRFAGARIELSKSHHGLHLYGRTTDQQLAHRCKNDDVRLELYTQWKFVSVTDIAPVGDSESDHTAALRWLIGQYFPPRTTVNDPEWTDKPRDDWDGHTDDVSLLGAAFQATGGAVFGDAKVTFGDLWENRVEKLAVAYPPMSDGEDCDRSRVDAALAQHLAFWTGCDCERILHLMWESKLVREKWHRRGDYYLNLTIEKACANQVDVHCRRRVKQDAPPQGDEIAQARPMSAAEVEFEPLAVGKLRGGSQTMYPEAQLTHFRGCVYVRTPNRVWIPGGEMLDRARFDASYGGFVFGLDSASEKTTKSAWEAFTQSQAIEWPKVEGIAFRPAMKPGAVFDEQGRSKINTYWPARIASKPGDASPFLRHVEKLLPDERDREILISYMAACVQYRGVKFQWCPLVQGVEGNGKTLLSRVVANALGRQFVHFPKAKHIDCEFNGWLFGKLFIGVEDIYTNDRNADVVETLKPMITGEFQEITFKGVDQTSADVVANFLLNSNHKDALKKTRNDRRFCVFYTAQQQAEDLDRDGMGSNYFETLYDWLRDDGYAIVTNYLENYQIHDEFNPTKGAQRAPSTSSTNEALQASLGPVEQSVMEAIEEGREGFVGNWVSSVALNQFLEQSRNGRVIPPNKRREFMRTLGYDYHPALKDGRLTRPSEVDGHTRPRLFVRADSPEKDLATVDEIHKVYTDAQRGWSPPAPIK